MKILRAALSAVVFILLSAGYIYPQAMVVDVAPMTLADADADGTVFVTIMFSEPMDIGISPMWSLNGMVDSPIFVVAGAWSGDMMWTGEFFFVDQDEETIGIYSISGFEDAGGTPLPLNESFTVTVDTRNPQNPMSTSAVTDPVNSSSQNSVTVNVGFMTAPEAGTVTVQLDDGITQVTGSAAAFTGGSTTMVSGIDATGLADGTITITAKIVDLAGNENSNGYWGSSTVEKETVRPVVLDVTPDALGEAEAGVVNVSVTFSEAMDTSVNPDVLLTGLTTDPYTISGSSWTVGDTVWTGTFTFLDENETATVMYSITGFTDENGNVMLDDNLFAVDVDTGVAPSTDSGGGGCRTSTEGSGMPGILLVLLSGFFMLQKKRALRDAAA